MNDCFNDSYILIQQLMKIFIDLNKASVTFYNFLAFKKFRTTQMYHYGWICRDFCSTKMQSCHIIFVVERFLIRLSILCNFIVASVKLTKKTMTFYLFDVFYDCIQRTAIFFISNFTTNQFMYTNFHLVYATYCLLVEYRKEFLIT